MLEMPAEGGMSRRDLPDGVADPPGDRGARPLGGAAQPPGPPSEAERLGERGHDLIQIAAGPLRADAVVQ